MEQWRHIHIHWSSKHFGGHWIHGVVPQGSNGGSMRQGTCGAPTVTYETRTRWWFQFVSYFPPRGNDPIWPTYFFQVKLFLFSIWRWQNGNYFHTRCVLSKPCFNLFVFFSLEGTEVSYLAWLKISVINPTLLHKKKQKSQVAEHCITSNGVEDLWHVACWQEGKPLSSLPAPPPTDPALDVWMPSSWSRTDLRNCLNFLKSLDVTFLNC